MIQVYQAFQSGKPIGPPDPQFQEKFPDHVDMLRYDLAFCSPDDTSLVIFPRFTGRDGTTTTRITVNRWRSFGIQLRVTDKELPVPLVGNGSIPPHDISNWITYDHPRPLDGPTDYSTFEAIPLAKYMQDRKLRLCAAHRSL